MSRGAARGLAVSALALILIGPTIATRVAVPLFNPILDAVDSEPSPEALSLHSSLSVADLHSDALLWDRSLLRRQSVGHVDVPRLIEGRIGLQMFTTVTKAPWGMNVDSNAGDSDRITLLAVVQGWPPRTWPNLTERALQQARKLHLAAERSDGRLSVVTSRAELEAHLVARARGSTAVAGLLGIEGAHALEGDLGNLDRVHRAGVRMMGLTHFFDNAVGGSAHGVAKGGLTAFGRLAVLRMQELGIAIDLAHASTALIDDVLDLATTPLIVSHTGVRSHCDNRRNLDDGRLARIADTGGLVGIGLWPVAVCGDEPADWARAVRRAADVAGVDHVGLGSDWDGGVAAMIDASGTAHLTDALLREGFTGDEIRKIMGGNVVRVFRETLPLAPSAPAGRGGAGR